MKHLAYIDLRALSLTNQNIVNIFIANQDQNQTKLKSSLRDFSRAFNVSDWLWPFCDYTDQNPLCYLILYQSMFFL